MNSEQAQQRLISERERLLEVKNAAGRLGNGAGEAQRQELSSADQHPAEQASETLERELDQSIVQRTEWELAEVEAALQRIEDGKYGICEICAQPIGEGRLEAMPAARYCVEDQSKAERLPGVRS